MQIKLNINTKFPKKRNDSELCWRIQIFIHFKFGFNSLSLTNRERTPIWASALTFVELLWQSICYATPLHASSVSELPTTIRNIQLPFLLWSSKRSHVFYFAQHRFNGKVSDSRSILSLTISMEPFHFYSVQFPIDINNYFKGRLFRLFPNLFCWNVSIFVE